MSTLSVAVFLAFAIAGMIGAYMAGRDDARGDRQKLATVLQQRDTARVKVIKLRARVAELTHGRDVLQVERGEAYRIIDDVAALAGDWDRHDALIAGPTIARRLRRAVAPRDREVTR